MDELDDLINDVYDKAKDVAIAQEHGWVNKSYGYCERAKKNLRDHVNALTAEVAALRARVAELEQAARWVSVDQRLPDVEEHVLTIYWTFGGGSAATIRALLDTGMWFDCGSGYLCPPNNVTHWRPLPTPPEAE